MKKHISKTWDYIQGFNGLSLIFYGVFIFVTSAIVKSKGSLLHLPFSSFLFGVLLCFICPFIIKKISVFSISKKTCITKNNYNNLQKLLFAIIPFIILLFFYIGFYPGGFSNDSFSQYEQALNNTYNDWHPVVQTLFAFKIPLILTNGWIGSITLFQIILLSLALGYTFHIIYTHANIYITAFVIFFILFNTQIINISLYAWKDVSFGIGALLLTDFSFQVYFTNGDWLKKRSNIFIFVITAVLTTLFRHNAILFTIPLIFAILISLKPKKAICIGCSVLVIIAVIKGPIYTVLNVEKPDKRQVETLGLPMTVIGAVVAITPDALDEETKEFAYKVAPQETWEQNYISGSYNPVKWNENTNNLVIEEYGAKKVIQMMINCIKNAPRVSLTALIELTQGVYTVSDKAITVTRVNISDNNYGIEMNDNYTLKYICRTYNYNYLKVFSCFHYLLGIIHLVLIISILAKFKINKMLNWKKLLFIIPIFCYNYGTTLLLTGVEDAARFFYYTYLIAPLLLVFIYKKEERNETETSVSKS